MKKFLVGLCVVLFVVAGFTASSEIASNVSYVSFGIYVGDKPVSRSEIQNLYVTFTGFSVHAILNGTSAWYTSKKSGTYDLTTLSGTFVNTANISVPSSAIVTQIRFDISGATVVINGTSHLLYIPSSAIYLDAQSLSAETLKGEYLDFDLSKSIEYTGNWYFFTPLIRVVGANARASLTGRVMYKSQPVPMATVSVENSSTIVSETYTTKTGRFTIGAVNDGDYTLKVDANTAGLSEYSTTVSLSVGNNELGVIKLSKVLPERPVLSFSLTTVPVRMAFFKWTSCANADGYRVWESTSTTKPLAEIADLSPAVTSYIARVKPESDYYFAVSSYNSAGQSWSGKLKLYRVPIVVATAQVGKNPNGIAVNPTTHMIYVVNKGSDTVSVIDGNTDKIVATVDVGRKPAGIAVNPITNKLYVTNEDADTVSVIDGNVNKLIETIPVESEPDSISVDPTTNMIYVVNEGSDTVSVINGNTNDVVATMRVGDHPQNIAVNTTTNMIYVANGYDDSVSVIDGNTNKVIETIPVENGPGNIRVDLATNMIYVVNWSSDTVSVIDGKTNKVVVTVQVGKNPNGIVVNPTTNMIYVVNGGSDTVSVIDGKTNDVVATVQVGKNPNGIVVNPTTNMIYVVNQGSNTVSVIDGNTNKIAVTVQVGKNPCSIAVNPTTNMIYVSNCNWGSNTVNVIDANK